MQLYLFALTFLILFEYEDKKYEMRERCFREKKKLTNKESLSADPTHKGN
jgi:hypothetical protein